jgi:hypothetical protein
MTSITAGTYFYDLVITDTANKLIRLLQGYATVSAGVTYQ